MTVVPRFEEEVIAAGARKYGGDEEKVPTTRVRHALCGGVLVTSRYQKAEELQTMMAILDELPDVVVKAMETIFCDSKAGSAYEITLKSGLGYVTWKLATAHIKATLTHVFGTNGTSVKAPGHEDYWIEPVWPGDVA